MSFNSVLDYTNCIGILAFILNIGSGKTHYTSPSDQAAIKCSSGRYACSSVLLFQFLCLVRALDLLCSGSSCLLEHRWVSCGL